MKKVNKNSPASRENSPALLCIFSGQTAPSPRHYTRNAPITKIGLMLGKPNRGGYLPMKGIYEDRVGGARHYIGLYGADWRDHVRCVK